MAIATQRANEHGIKMTEFQDPKIEVKIIEGRATWILHFTRDYGPNWAVAPAEMFSVTVDDRSGKSSFRDETAEM